MKIAVERLKAGKRKSSTGLSLGGYVQGPKKGIESGNPRRISNEKSKNEQLIKHILKSPRPCLSLKNKITKR
jgi:hypothetical protein